MDNIIELLREKANDPGFEAGRPSNIRRIAINGDEVVLQFQNGRQQMVNIVYSQSHYRLISVILRRGVVAQIDRESLLPSIWRRNRSTDLVAFEIDKYGRLIGAIEHPMRTADADELLYYLEQLAWECDKLEYLLSGRDQV